MVGEGARRLGESVEERERTGGGGRGEEKGRGGAGHGAEGKRVVVVAWRKEEGTEGRVKRERVRGRDAKEGGIDGNGWAEEKVHSYCYTCLC